jgi:hypothetical protein
MIAPFAADGSPEPRPLDETTHPAPLVAEPSLGKVAKILDEDGGGFGLEYDDTRGRKNRMRLDARTYEGAIREARSFLGVQPDDRDADGDRWTVE